MSRTQGAGAHNKIEAIGVAIRGHAFVWQLELMVWLDRALMVTAKLTRGQRGRRWPVEVS
jgi:hypothetical protein